MKIGTFLLLGSLGICLLTAILSIFFSSSNESLSLPILILDILGSAISIPAVLLMLLGLDEIRDKIDNTKNSPLRFSVAFLGIHLAYCIISTIIISLTVIDIGFYTVGSVTKNMMCFLFISASLVSVSLAFNKLNKLNYPTRLLLTSLILLPIPALTGFIVSWFALQGNIFRWGGFLKIFTIAMTIFLSIALMISLVEMLFSVNKLQKDIIKNIAPELLLTKEKRILEKSIEKTQKEEKAVIGK